MLDGPTLANIYLGKITKWNDPAITKLNPTSSCRSQAIAVVHRSDGSGTTFIFTNYLSKVSPDWKSKVGASTAVEWPVGVGAKGNEGVAGKSTKTKGAIGYVEYAYAMQNKLTYVDMINQDGKTVAPTAAAFQAAAANADWAQGRRLLPDPDQPAGRAAWPITGATFILMHKQPAGPGAPARPSSSSTGPTPMAARWPRSSTTCRCRPRSSRDREDLGDEHQGRRRQAGLSCRAK